MTKLESKLEESYPRMKAEDYAFVQPQGKFHQSPFSDQRRASAK